MFPRRFTVGPARDSVETRLRYDTSARTIEVYAGDDGSYFVDHLPLFIPSEKRLSVSGIAFDCVAQPIARDFEITCHTKGKAAELHAFFERDAGFTWFEYFCGHPTKICRYRYSNGQKLLNPAALQKLRKDGALRSLSERM
jgi:hypothetical protein